MFSGLLRARGIFGGDATIYKNLASLRRLIPDDMQGLVSSPSSDYLIPKLTLLSRIKNGAISREKESLTSSLNKGQCPSSGAAVRIGTSEISGSSKQGTIFLSNLALRLSTTVGPQNSSLKSGPSIVRTKQAHVPLRPTISYRTSGLFRNDERGRIDLAL